MCKCKLSWRKHAYIILPPPLKPHFYIVKLGFTGVYIIFLISAENIDCGYSLEPPHRGGSNEYTQSMFWADITSTHNLFWAEIWKNIGVFIWKCSAFGGKNFNIYLNRLVFVMYRLQHLNSYQHSKIIIIIIIIIIIMIIKIIIIIIIIKIIIMKIHTEQFIKGL